jgi:hypothetical protein
MQNLVFLKESRRELLVSLRVIYPMIHSLELLVKNPDERITVNTALCHSWCMKTSTNNLKESISPAMIDNNGSRTSLRRKSVSNEHMVSIPFESTLAEYLDVLYGEQLEEELEQCGTFNDQRPKEHVVEQVQRHRRRSSRLVEWLKEKT